MTFQSTNSRERWHSKPSHDVGIFIAIALLLFIAGCSNEGGTHVIGPTFGDDIEFLQRQTEIVRLSTSDGSGQVAIAPKLQARVMTTSSAGDSGRSYGWINKELFEAGADTSAAINAFGGEDRFWLGPEGGQFSLYHRPGASFTLDNWFVPRLLDIEPFDFAEKSTHQATFVREASLQNYSGFQFDFQIRRKIRVLEEDDIIRQLDLSDLEQIASVGFETTNVVTNTGSRTWKRDSGLLSIWLLGMFKASPEVTVVIPFEEGLEESRGPIVNDSYFGKVPENRLLTSNGVLFFRGDAEFRSKIGLSPYRAKDIMGSYDAANQVLTLVRFNKPNGVTAYVNSMWEIQEDPYRGDVINSYNDGPAEPGAAQLGSFYELESSSPAVELEPMAFLIHIQQTYHFEGEESALNNITETVLGVSLDEIKTVFFN